MACLAVNTSRSDLGRTGFTGNTDKVRMDGLAGSFSTTPNNISFIIFSVRSEQMDSRTTSVEKLCTVLPLCKISFVKIGRTILPLLGKSHYRKASV